MPAIPLPPATVSASVRASRRLAAALCLLLAACANGAHVPAPSIGRAAPLPPAEPAVMAIPIVISLARLRAELEAAFPSVDSLDRARCSALGGVVCHQYVYRRDSLDVRMSGDRLELTARLRYRGRVAMTRHATLGSCGYGGEPMRRAALRFATSLYWRSDWRLASRNTALAAELQDPCRVTALGLDATPLMRRIVDAQLRDLTALADSLIPGAADLATAADSLWREFQRPSPLDTTGSLWLAMNAERVSLAPVTGAPGTVRTGIVITARPRVVLGASPSATADPLPSLTLSAAPAGLRIPVDVTLPYRELARHALAAVRPEAAATGLDVRDMLLWGAGDTLVVRLDLAGKLDGSLYLVGRLGYDAAARTVRIDDLRYTVESQGLLTSLKATLGAPLIRRALNQATSGGRLDVGAQLDSARYALTQQLNRQLAPGMLVGGGITDVRIEGLHTTPDAIVLRVRLDGAAQLVVQ